jgi:hypothetical protein
MHLPHHKFCIKFICVIFKYFRNLIGRNLMTSLQSGHLVNSASSVNCQNMAFMQAVFEDTYQSHINMLQELQMSRIPTSTIMCYCSLETPFLPNYPNSICTTHIIYWIFTSGYPKSDPIRIKIFS